MASFTFELVSPEKVLFSGPVESVTVPSVDGEMTVFVGHAPVMATLKPGVVAIDEGKGGPTKVFVRGGFAEVGGASVTILAEQAILLADLRPEMLAADVKAAEEDVADAKSDKARQAAQAKLDQLREVQKALSTATHH
jgi:F-type H+-transporting ATPase subunit epsilon